MLGDFDGRLTTSTMVSAAHGSHQSTGGTSAYMPTGSYLAVSTDILGKTNSESISDLEMQGEEPHTQSQSQSQTSDDAEIASLLSSAPVSRIRGMSENKRVRARWNELYRRSASLLGSGNSSASSSSSSLRTTSSQRRSYVSSESLGIAQESAEDLDDDDTAATATASDTRQDTHGGRSTTARTASIKARQLNGSGSGNGRDSGKLRGSLVEAQEVLEEACTLPAYVNEPGESFAEAIRSSLGELMAVGCCITRKHTHLHN
jgi:hypothetical protein